MSFESFYLIWMLGKKQPAARALESIFDAYYFFKKIVKSFISNKALPLFWGSSSLSLLSPLKPCAEICSSNRTQSKLHAETNEHE